jgi:hypothetical protein
MFGITRVPKEHRGFGTQWLCTLPSGEKAVMGDFPSIIIVRWCWKIWSTAWRQEASGTD